MKNIIAISLIFLTLGSTLASSKCDPKLRGNIKGDFMTECPGWWTAQHGNSCTLEGNCKKYDGSLIRSPALPLPCSQNIKSCGGTLTCGPCPSSTR